MRSRKNVSTSKQSTYEILIENEINCWAAPFLAALVLTRRADTERSRWSGLHIPLPESACGARLRAGSQSIIEAGKWKTGHGENSSSARWEGQSPQARIDCSAQPFRQVPPC